MFAVVILSTMKTCLNTIFRNVNSIIFSDWSIAYDWLINHLLPCMLTSWQRNGSNVDPFLNSYWSSSRWQGYREGYTSGWDRGEGVLWDAQWLGVEFWNVWCMHTYFRALKFQENMVRFFLNFMVNNFKIKGGGGPSEPLTPPPSRSHLPLVMRHNYF